MSTESTAARTLTIDAAHSEVTFTVRHLISRVRGRFTEFGGTILFDETAPEKSTVEFQAQTTSIDTNQKDRDAHLRSDDFFSSEKFPTITFKSTSITRVSGEDYHVEGDLTIRDVTKRVVVPVAHLGKAKDPWGNEKVAFEAELTINRKDFGLNWNAALETGGFLVGDEVKIQVAVQAA